MVIAMRAAFRGVAWCMTLLLLGIELLGAQPTKLPTREELDQLVSPKLSTTANRGVAATKATIELGEIEDSKSIVARFTLKNATSNTVVITELRSTCSCLKVVTRPSTLQPKQSITIEVEYNPKGRSGKFSQEVLVYTSLDAKSPTERLTLTGTTKSTNRFPHLSKRMGNLYLSRTTVSLDGVKPGSTRRESIVVANGGERSVTLTAKSLIEGLEFRLTPTTLKPGEEGEIVISYTPRRAIDEPIETLLIVEGCDGKPTERAIKVMINR